MNPIGPTAKEWAEFQVWLLKSWPAGIKGGPGLVTEKKLIALLRDDLDLERCFYMPPNLTGPHLLAACNAAAIPFVGHPGWPDDVEPVPTEEGIICCDCELNNVAVGLQESYAEQFQQYGEIQSAEEVLFLIRIYLVVYGSLPSHDVGTVGNAALRTRNPSSKGVTTVCWNTCFWTLSVGVDKEPHKGFRNVGVIPRRFTPVSTLVTAS